MTPDSAAALLARKIVDAVTEDVSGSGPRYQVVTQDMPKNLFPAGNLGPKSLMAERMGDFRQTEFTPSSMGFVFRFHSKADASLRVSGAFSIFPSLHPTLQELREVAARYEESVPREIDWDRPSPEHRRMIEGLFVKYRPRYVRHRVSFDVLLPVADLRIDDGYHDLPGAPTQIQGRIDSVTDAGRDSWVPLGPNGKPPSDIPVAALLDGQRYADFFARYDEKAKPTWRVRLQYRAWREGEDLVSVELLLANDLREDEAGELPKTLDPHLFGPMLKVVIPHGFLVPLELDLLRTKDYRVDPYVMALGINCDTAFQAGVEADLLCSDVLPIYLQTRIKPAELAGPPSGLPSFEDLSSDPLRHLRIVGDALSEYAEQWRSGFERYSREGLLRPEQRDDYMRSLEAYLEEVRRFRLGLDALGERANSDLLTAFRLMNETFVMQARAKPVIRAWHLFQLVFIVSNLPDFMARKKVSTSAEPSPVILWYPTGGGKTEAYLGLAIVHSFWDRLRGKSFGITAWCKFPLRLLSMQQLSRICHLTAYADMVRASTPSIPDKLRGDPFSVGLFAGGTNSTNFLDWPPEAWKDTALSFEVPDSRAAQSDASGPFIRKNHKVDRCPKCMLNGQEGKIATTFDSALPGFRHRCDACGYQLLLHVSDTETFRRLPTVVVGTIDKLAALGRVPATKIFFGYAKRQCRAHGYLLAAADRCPVLSCGQPLEAVQESVDPTPSLLIQDELHFLRETLGAFDSHYETMTLAIMREAARELAPRTGSVWKIVGSTATIEGYADQVRHLYGYRNVIRFPEAGPVRGRSFYANEEPGETHRFVIGLRPQNMSHIDAVMKVLLSFHRFTLPLATGDDVAWRALGEPFASMASPDRAILIERYRTSLSYALTRAECGQINKSFIQQLNPQVVKEGLPEFEESRVRNLTGEMDSDDVLQALNDLEVPPARWIQAVTATSMVSHGVDLNVLNFMVFRGQPHTISEWIQAMSRIGRARGFPGVVVNVYNPNRERDASYYRHHKKYIEHAGTLIRVVPITRFSPSALRKTAPGLFYNAVAFFAAPPDLLYVYREQLKRRFPLIKDQVKALMKSYLNLNATPLEPKETRLLEELENQIERIQAVLESPTSPEKTLEAIDAMTSLREVDVPVLIAPVYQYERFSRRRG